MVKQVSLGSANGPRGESLFLQERIIQDSSGGRPDDLHRLWNQRFPQGYIRRISPTTLVFIISTIEFNILERQFWGDRVTTH